MIERKDAKLSKDEADARTLGLSYGVYMGYKETGYLTTWLLNQIKQRNKKKESVNVIESNIVGAGSSGKVGRRDCKLA